MTTSDDVRRHAGHGPVATIWNGTELVPYVDPRPSRPPVVRTNASRRTVLMGAATVIALGLVLAAAGHLALARLGLVGDPGRTVVGTVDLLDLASTANGCQGAADYADIGTGTSVTLTDDSGSVLGTSELGRPLAFGESGCVFTFRIPHVPTSSQVYTVQVAGREAVARSRWALDQDGWTFEVNLDR